MIIRTFVVAASILTLPSHLLAQEERPPVSHTLSTLPEPPVADRRPHSFTMHGITVEDPYHWLRDQGYPEIDDDDVLAYLNEENAYFEAIMAPNQQLIDTLYDEMRGRLPENDAIMRGRNTGFGTAARLPVATTSFCLMKMCLPRAMSSFGSVRSPSARTETS